MLHLRCVLGLWFLNVVVVEGGFLESCRGRLFNLNVVLLEDDVSMWSLKYVREAVYSAINKDKLRNEAAGRLSLSLSVLIKTQCSLFIFQMYTKMIICTL